MAVVVDDLPPLVEMLHVLHSGVAEHPAAQEHDGADDHGEDADAEGSIKGVIFFSTSSRKS